MASFKLAVSLIVLLYCVMPSITSIEASSGRLGGKFPIDDVNAPEIVSVANFAIEEHKKLTNEDLKLSKVVSGWYQVVAGLKYGLILEVSEGKFRLYDAVTVAKLDHSKELISFRPVVINEQA